MGKLYGFLAFLASAEPFEYRRVVFGHQTNRSQQLIVILSVRKILQHCYLILRTSTCERLSEFQHQSRLWPRRYFLGPFVDNREFSFLEHTKKREKPHVLILRTSTCSLDPAPNVGKAGIKCTTGLTWVNRIILKELLLKPQWAYD